MGTLPEFAQFSAIRRRHDGVRLWTDTGQHYEAVAVRNGQRRTPRGHLDICRRWRGSQRPKSGDGLHSYGWTRRPSALLKAWLVRP